MMVPVCGIAASNVAASAADPAAPDAAAPYPMIMNHQRSVQQTYPCLVEATGLGQVCLGAAASGLVYIQNEMEINPWKLLGSQ